MHGTEHIKFANAKQAKQIYQYKNIKEKLYKLMQRYGTIKQLTPYNIAIKINSNNRQCLNMINHTTV